MNVISRCLVLGLTGALGAAWTAAGAQDAAGSFQRTLAIDGPVELEVQTGSGSITIRRGSAERVEVLGRIHVWSRSWWRRGSVSVDVEELVRQLEADPPIEVAGNRVRVGFIPEEQRELWGPISISYEIEVPRDTQITSRTGSGRQEITSVSGSLEASAGSGSIVLTDIEGRVAARTGSGSIRAERIAGAFDAHAGSGSIRLAQIAAGDVAVSTGSGSVELRGVDGALHARTGSGRIEVQGKQTGRWDLETGSGSVLLELPADAAFELDAHTGSGRIDTDHPVTVRGTVGRGRLSGDVRGGGPLLRARTGSGSISIE